MCRGTRYFLQSARRFYVSIVLSRHRAANRRLRACLHAAVLTCSLALGTAAVPPARADGAAACPPGDGYLGDGCRRVARVATAGSWDLYLTGYAWHIDGYSDEQRHALNAKSWGGGAGKHWTDERGNEDILFAFVFLDSHVRPEPIGGYARQWFTPPVLGGLSVGGGFFAGFTARKDVMSYLPVPLALPVASVRYRRASVMGAFIPHIPGANKGDVAFFWVRYEF